MKKQIVLGMYALMLGGALIFQSCEQDPINPSTGGGGNPAPWGQDSTGNPGSDSTGNNGGGSNGGGQDNNPGGGSSAGDTIVTPPNPTDSLGGH